VLVLVSEDADHSNKQQWDYYPREEHDHIMLLDRLRLSLSKNVQIYPLWIYRSYLHCTETSPPSQEGCDEGYSMRGSLNEDWPRMTCTQ